MTTKKRSTSTTHRSRCGTAPREGSAARALLLAAAILLPSGVVLYAAAPPRSHHTRTRSSSIHAVRTTASRTAAPAADLTFARDAAPLVKQYCLGCHSGANAAAGIRLDTYHTAASVLAARDVWENVSLNVKSSRMPPVGAPHPTAAQRERLAGWIESTLSKGQCLINDPGRVTLRRLNRAEYNNTIRDLVGVDFHPADDFPSDDVGYGFDNIGDVLSLSPVLMEKYLKAAETIAKRAVHADPPQKPVMNRVQSSSFGHGEQRVDQGRFEFPAEADYDIRATIAGRKADMFRAVQLVVQVDGKDYKTFTIGGGNRNGRGFDTRLHLTEGDHLISGKMLLPPFDEKAQAAYEKLRETTQKQLVDGTVQLPETPENAGPVAT